MLGVLTLDHVVAINITSTGSIMEVTTGDGVVKNSVFEGFLYGAVIDVISGNDLRVN